MSEFDAKAFLKTLSVHPGVYRMYDQDEQLLYVGKAKNLKNRVSSYFRTSGLSLKTQALVSQIARIEFTVTSSETEALLLEQTQIKEHRPPFNILMRDDKSYPYIFISRSDYPQIEFSRGRKKRSGRYFGPYPNSTAVKETLNMIHKVFRLRQCDDNFFNNRSRPCLQHQIERCSAPCVDLISDEDYQQDVRKAELFLQGRSDELLEQLQVQMDAAAVALEFELAAHLRDQLIQLRKIQEQQYVYGEQGDADVFALVSRPGGFAVSVLFVRAGRVLGSRHYFPSDVLSDNDAERLQAFLNHYYLASDNREIPAEIICNHAVSDGDMLIAAIGELYKGKSPSLSSNVRSHRARWVQLAITNAEQALVSHLSRKGTLEGRFRALKEALGLDFSPDRLECFDISHSSGEATVASCVVLGKDGPIKSEYRKFNIEGITPGDDYAAMKQALTRRYKRLQSGDGKKPDILVLDGGKGQLSQAREVFTELGVTDVVLLAVSKGSTRKQGFETLYLENNDQEFDLEADSKALHLIEQVRDEAHRFAVASHRQRRDNTRRTSRFESIPGVGPKRRQALLRHFGGQREVLNASIQELAKVSGISKSLAEQIYYHLHPEQ
ncbi:excinuclease ABC subunit UvrC [Oceanospirillum sediminis]|uniref:UvrABC system protein C n=1 Tax=Oceanospirillum sediminis TaxID=2760088 RepID=A0A839IT87_9GAMM|nr:excinuclease ABC subunit UvrC [Oceanospirillum sediminis]MBB1487647.1 excinuclease ABC subunit UvrC [Oceanospirillum sediminis]